MRIIRIIAAISVVAIVFSACKKDSKKPANSSHAEYYFTGNVNGSDVDWEATFNGDGWAAGSGSVFSIDQGEISGGITALMTHYPGEHPQFGVEFKTFDKHEDDDGATVFNSFVKTGLWTLSNNNDYVVGDKSVVIHYIDNSGKEYSSVGSQTGGSINVLSATKTSGDNYNSYSGLQIKFTLSCTLYPVDGTDAPIKLTNGQGIVFLEDMYVN